MAQERIRIRRICTEAFIKEHPRKGGLSVISLAAPYA
jgi:hypothetical protein